MNLFGMFKYKKKPHYEQLAQKWAKKHQHHHNKLWKNHGSSLNKLLEKSKHLTLGSIGGLALLATPFAASLPSIYTLIQDNLTRTAENKTAPLSFQLQTLVPSIVRPLNDDEEQKISKSLSDYFGFKVTPELDGIRLNRSYGLIGGEQHLYRYPGDTLDQHADNDRDRNMFLPSGIAPGLGAWRYFSTSKETFTEKDKLNERYYIAVQTFLAPGFAQNFGKYRDFFKYRKMLIVNTKTGQAVVTVVGDAGPAEWTGKHLGGSPEVMHYLGLATGPRKGPVLYFFIDDPTDSIPLGPVEGIQLANKT